MFLFQPLNHEQIIMWFIILLGLIVINELTRRSKYVGYFVFIILPIFLTIFLWPKTAGKDSSVGTWFH